MRLQLNVLMNVSRLAEISRVKRGPATRPGARDHEQGSGSGFGSQELEVGDQNSKVRSREIRDQESARGDRIGISPGRFPAIPPGTGSSRPARHPAGVLPIPPPRPPERGATWP